MYQKALTELREQALSLQRSALSFQPLAFGTKHY
jgi:hypothetical protein